MKSFGRVRRFVVVLGAALVLSCLLAAPAFADNPANDECLTCHQSMTDWSVVDVDYNTACRKCHTDGLLGTHPYHNSGANCGAFCHTGWGGSNLTARPAFSAPEGTFAAADSVSTTSSVLHVIHAKSSWLGTVNTSVGDCRTCHAPATCSACHTAPLAARHATHAATATPFVGDLSDGLVVDSTPNHCASPNCHDLASTGAFTPVDHESDSKSADPVVTRVNWGTKSYVPRPSATAGLFALSNVGGATIEIAATGDKIEVIANKDPYRGKARIWVDGVATATVDTYSPTTLDQQVIYQVKFAASGSHTVKVEVLYDKNASSRGYWIAIDSFRVYTGMKTTVAPACVSCHPTKTVAHGTTFPHEASLTVGTYASFTCQQCHSMALFTEHGRTSSVTYGGSSCSDCHTTYAPYVIDTYNYTCSWTGYGPGCHQTTQAAHTATITAHTASDAATQDCRDCHGSRLDVIHNDADATRLQNASLVGGGSNGLAYSTNCLTCHSTTLYPTTKDCTDAGCHVASGVVSMATHPAPLHTAAPAANEAPSATLGGKTCSVCHAMELINEHGKASSLTSTSATIGCMSCHGATYFPTNWLGQVNTCVACHPLAGGKAGDPHETTDYNTKHDYSPYGTNSSCGIGGGTYCHNGVSALLGNVTMVDQIHYNKPGVGDCTSCHDATSVPNRNTCASAGCHDGVARAASHDLVARHNAASATIAANANCVICHTGYTDLRNHTKACAGCHGNSVLTATGTRYLTGTFTAQCTGCHVSTVLGTNYDPTNPNHYNETTHTAGAMTTAVGAYSNKNTCSDCHSATLLTAHGTSSVGAVGCTSGGTGNTGCHRQTTPVNAVAEVAANWTNNTCSDCHPTKHTTYTAGTHTATLGTTGIADGCANVGCHQTGATTDVRLVHDRVTSGCTATGTDGNGWTGACHQLNKTMTTGTLSCGSGGTGAVKCHINHTNSNHVPSHNVTDTVSLGCLAAGTGCHESGPSKSVLTTSTISIHATDTIGTLVSGKTNNGCNICHGGSGWADVHATAKTNGTGMRCAGCHNGTVVGAHLYDPEDPNHYYSASHDTTRAAVDTTSGTTVDFHSTSVAYGGYTCTTCHSADLKTEHFKTSSTFAQVPGTYADKCIECHELKVDAFGSAWTPASCAGVGSGCHATKHTAMATKHNSSAETLTAPGSTAGIVSSPATELAEGFESGNFTLNGWTVSTTTYCTVQTTAPHSGTYTARLNWRASSTTAYYIQKTFDLSGYTSPVISFWSKTAALVSTDVYRLGYSTDGGTTWTYPFTKTGTAESAWTEHASLALPANAAVLIRFEVKPNTSNATTARYWYVDDIAITGMAGTWSTTPLAVGSTVAQSCGASYPNGGTNCHDVTDVADIHSRATTTVASVTYNGCRVCHRTNTAVPASLNCQSSGCHAGINSDSHRDNYHESSIASGAAGQIFAGTGFIANWCTGCHDDSIDDEHSILSSYSTNGCAVCHKKASDSTVPTVTAVDTSATIHGDSVAGNELCTDCHKTVTATKIHSQRLGDTSTVPTVQFSTSWSGHRMYDTMSGMMDPVGGYAWTRPTATTFLLTGWQAYNQVVRCSDCHGSVSGATGPHGAAMTIGIASGYNSSYQAGTMTISNFATSGGICTKCHTGISTVNTAHNTGNHTNYSCVTCHVKTAHAWKRPRLLGYSTDPLPYRTTANGGLQGISLKAHTTTWAQTGDCQASCYSSHSAVSPVWP